MKEKQYKMFTAREHSPFFLECVCFVAHIVIEN